MTNSSDQPTTEATASAVSRRTMLRGAAVGGVAVPLLAACGSSDSGSGSGAASASGSASGSAGASASGSASASAGGSGGTTVAVSDVPVGGGTVLADAKVVVTQPTKGEFKAFSAICTHQGCTVTKVENKAIVCPCHGSHFSITDGAPESGPAPSPLAAKKATLSGGQISVT